jgi:hypothetical protein
MLLGSEVQRLVQQPEPTHCGMCSIRIKASGAFVVGAFDGTSSWLCPNCLAQAVMIMNREGMLYEVFQQDLGTGPSGLYSILAYGL